MSKSPAALSLEELRGKIDAIDVQLQQLISERARVARQVGEVKGLSRTADFYRPEREAQVLRKVVERNKGPLRDEEMVRLFRELMSACLAQEEPLKVAYLGPEGTFTQAAVLKHFGHSVRALSVPTIAEVFHEVEAGVAEGAGSAAGVAGASTEDGEAAAAASSSSAGWVEATVGVASVAGVVEGAGVVAPVRRPQTSHPPITPITSPATK